MYDCSRAWPCGGAQAARGGAVDVGARERARRGAAGAGEGRAVEASGAATEVRFD